jgi:hypothetical protein
MSAEKEITSDLTVSDLRILNNLIEMVSTKGLIKPADFMLIGSIYEKITSLLKSVSSEQSVNE